MVPSLCSELVYCVLQWTVSTVQRRCCVPGCLLSAWRPWPDLLNPLFHTIISFSSGVLRSKTQSWRSTSSPQMGKNAAVLFFCFVFFPVFSVFNFEWNTSSSLYMRCFKDTNNPSTLPPSLHHPSLLSPPSSLLSLLHWCCYLPRWWCHRLSGARASLPETVRRERERVREPFWPLLGCEEAAGHPKRLKKK